MSKVYVATSSLHGKGVFATRKIKEGEIVGYYNARKTRLTSEENPYVIEVYDDNEQFVEYRLGTNEFRYINHSTEPNIDMRDDDFKMVALHDIVKNEELTWYYGSDFEESMTCSD